MYLQRLCDAKIRLPHASAAAIRLHIHPPSQKRIAQLADDGWQ